MSISVEPLTPTIGAEVSGIDLKEPMTEAQNALIQKAFLDHKVLFFRDQHLSPAAQVAFAKRFGPLDSHPVNPTLAGAEADVQVIENDGSWARGYYTDKWHSDVTFQPRPYKGAVLQAMVLPSIGGDTLWSNLNAVYESLPDGIRHFIDGLEAKHGWSLDSQAKAGDEQHYHGVTHPVVRVHPETGQKSIFVNEMFTRIIVGVTPNDSQLLLRMLTDAIKAPETQVRLRWRPGTVAIWDNRCTAHYAALDYKERRVMHRVTLAGERPIAPHEWAAGQRAVA